MIDLALNIAAFLFLAYIAFIVIAGLGYLALAALEGIGKVLVVVLTPIVYTAMAIRHPVIAWELIKEWRAS